MSNPRIVQHQSGLVLGDNQMYASTESPLNIAYPQLYAFDREVRIGKYAGMPLYRYMHIFSTNEITVNHSDSTFVICKITFSKWVTSSTVINVFGRCGSVVPNYHHRDNDEFSYYEPHDGYIFLYIGTTIWNKNKAFTLGIDYIK